jgi:serine protease AprX
MRLNRANSAKDSRSNALWGRGSRGESRSNALWGRGGRRAGAVVAALTVAFAAASGAAATVGVSHGGTPTFRAGSFGTLKAYVQSSLLSAIQQNPKQTFDVIVQGDKRQNSATFFKGVFNNKSGAGNELVKSGNVHRQFTAITGGEAKLTGWQILFMARLGLATAILSNDTVQQTGSIELPSYNTQLWPWAVGAPVDWVGMSPKTPTIAIVDSGIDAKGKDVGGRVLGQVNLDTLGPNKADGDGYGHGTFVAGIAAGNAGGKAGVAPKANLLSIDIMNDKGQATVADVVNAADWILKNKAQYNIKVANFSLHAVNRASIMFDPIDQAVEKLWLNGVTVVAAAGNYAVDGQPSGVQFAPGNDPLVITVGAADIGSALKPLDDTAAPWSAYGYTPDGFAKPDISAPGRYMIGPVPTGAGLALERPDSVVAPGYMQLSGTSFSAPVVSAAAAVLLGQHPDWTPDQVKGALMLTATKIPLVTSDALGVGEVNVAAARLYQGTPPNPNAAIEKFVTTLSDGTKALDASAWQQTALNDAAWASAAWSDAAWASAAWASAAWASAAWSDAAWASAAWASAAWSDAAWSDAAWSDAAWADNASGDDVVPADETTATQTEQDSVLSELGIVDGSCDPTLTQCVASTATNAVGAVTNTVGAVTSTVGGLLP